MFKKQKCCDKPLVMQGVPWIDFCAPKESYYWENCTKWGLFSKSPYLVIFTKFQFFKAKKWLLSWIWPFYWVFIINFDFLTIYTGILSKFFFKNWKLYYTEEFVLFSTILNSYYTGDCTKQGPLVVSYLLFLIFWYWV